jgi:hypothetical protein
MTRYWNQAGQPKRDPSLPTQDLNERAAWEFPHKRKDPLVRLSSMSLF